MFVPQRFTFFCLAQRRCACLAMFIRYKRTAFLLGVNGRESFCCCLRRVVAESAKIDTLNGPVAQLVEQRIENPRVSGSIPLQATIYFMLESLFRAC